LDSAVSRAAGAVMASLRTGGRHVLSLKTSRARFIAAATAKTHVSRLLMKLGAHDRAQLVMIAYETGLVTPG
jgi:DNA-binding CsgD family transcriptional regulator